MTKIPHRIFLSEDELPRQWYNLRADMKELPDPLLNPATGKPAIPRHKRPEPEGLKTAKPPVL